MVRWTTGRRAELAGMWRPEISLRQIAEHFGCSTAAISMVAARFGLPRRAKGQPSHPDHPREVLGAPAPRVMHVPALRLRPVLPPAPVPPAPRQAPKPAPYQGIGSTGLDPVHALRDPLVRAQMGVR